MHADRILSHYFAPISARKYGKKVRMMTKKEKRRFIEYLKLNKELNEASERGALLVIDREYVSASELAGVCIFQERGLYMSEDCEYNGKEVIKAAIAARRESKPDEYPHV